MKKLFIFSIILFLLFAIADDTVAQCAMCKATAQEAAKNKGQFGILDNTQNQGIFYLMAIPYIIFGVIGYVWYKRYKKLKSTKDNFEF